MIHVQHGLYMGLHWSWWVLWALIGLALVWALARTVGTPGPKRPDDRGRFGGAHPDKRKQGTTKEIHR